jgi:hypothetical protein
MEEAVSEEYKKELRAQMQKFMQDKEKEFTRREQESRSTLEMNLRKTISSDFENKLRLLENANKDNEEKLKTSRQKELEFLKKEQDLLNKEAELEISLQRRLQEERNKLSKEIRDLEEQRIATKETEYQLRLKELEKQLYDQKKLAEEMKRKAEQGSMQLQGEVQELALEEMLRIRFPYDQIGPVAKGVRGADCIQTVRNNFGEECGKIIYESKRTQSFSQEWVEKLKADMRSQGAMVAVIVTQAMPKDLDRFGEINGVWICTFSEVKALAHVLREGLLQVHKAHKSQENKGDKMTMLYDFLTSTEFSEQWKAIREGLLDMKQSVQKERDMMERLWKAREKQLEKVLLNAAHFRGSIDGIAGKAIDIPLLEDTDDLLEE